MAARRDADRERAPDAAPEVSRNRADFVVDSEPFQEPHAEGADGAADRSDETGPHGNDEFGAGRDGNQSADGAVQSGAQVNPAENVPRQSEGGEHARG